MLSDKFENFFKSTFNSTPFERRMAQEYAEFEKNNTKKLYDIKVKKELNFKKVKRFSFLLNFFMACLLIYSYNDGASVLFLSFCAFIIFINVSYIKYRKKHISNVEKVWTITGFDDIVKKEFLESYASNELLKIYKGKIGESRYKDFLFENGSDDKKIKIKLLIEE
jgi:hypothetical protein